MPGRTASASAGRKRRDSKPTKCESCTVPASPRATLRDNCISDERLYVGLSPGGWKAMDNSIGSCENCGHTFQYRLVHNGFGDSAYAYCDKCSFTVLLSG